MDDDYLIPFGLFKGCLIWVALLPFIVEHPLQ